MKTSDIRFKVTLNDQNVPQDIKWQASDAQNNELKDCKSMMVSIWDAVEKTTLSINLWTVEMTTDEMHSQYFQTLLSATESYARATGNPHAIEDMKKFASELARKTAEWENGK